MTLAEWSKQIFDELRDAGFDVHEYQGFPIVPMPSEFPEIVRFLEFKPTLEVERRIYAEGCLFSPLGAWDVADRLKVEAQQRAAIEAEMKAKRA